MTDPTTARDQTAVLISHAAAWSRTAPEADSRPAIVQAVDNWNRVLNSDAGSPRLPVPRPPDPHSHRLDAAARRAPGVYPGPAGELICRELLAAADLGYLFDLGHRSERSALMHRLAEQVLTGS